MTNADVKFGSDNVMLTLVNWCTIGGAENKTAQKFCQHYNSSDNLYNYSDKH